MKLSVDSLRKAGSFVGAPVKREVSWTHNGETHTADVWIRPLSYHSAVNDVRALSSDGDVSAPRIAYSVCDEHGKPVFTVADITGFDDDGNPVMEDDGQGNKVERGAIPDSLTWALWELIGEVNGLGKTTGEASG